MTADFTKSSIAYIDSPYRQLQCRVYHFLERPKTKVAIFYHCIMFLFVFLAFILNVLSTIDEYRYITNAILVYLEIVLLFSLFGEYCLRMWSFGWRPKFHSWRGKLQFARQPLVIVDSGVILGSVLILTLASDQQIISASGLRALRFFQIIRVIRMDRRGGSWKLMASVLYDHRQELFTTLYIGFIGIICCSFVMFLVEKEEDGSSIQSFADAIWWTIISVCTVGYGDVVPKSTGGKFVAVFCAICGISFYSLPGGILGSAFALKSQQSKRKKRLIARRVPAATYLQSIWRCYLLNENRHQKVLTFHSSEMPLVDNCSENAHFEENKIVQRVVCRLRYLVARRKFRIALRPYDVRDVLDQHSQQHLDLTGRLKVLQRRLNHILGYRHRQNHVGPASPSMSSASLTMRIVKVDKILDEIDDKLEALLEMCREDLKYSF